MGVNVTVIVHLAPAAMLVPQVLVCVNAEGLATIVMPVNATVWLLVKVTAGGVPLEPTNTAPKFRLVAESVTGATPVPDSVTFCGLFAALSVSVTDALRAPKAEGVKLTLMVHAWPAGKLGRQLLVWPKSEMFVPVTAILVKFAAAVPVLVTVTGEIPLVVLTT